MNQPSYVPVFDAMKIYEQKPEPRVRLWFMVLFILFGASRLLPVFDADFSQFAVRAVRFVQGEGTFPILSDAQIRFIIFHVLLLALSVVAGADYLLLYLNAAKDKNSAADGRHIVRVLLFSLILGGLFIFSSTLFLIPYYLFTFMFYFVPAEILTGDLALSKAMKASYHQTKGKRLPIGINVLFLLALINLAQSAIFALTGASELSVALVGGFFFAWRTLAGARLAGILYRAMVVADWTTKPPLS